MTVCRYFQQGRCRYGDSCRFEHPGRTTSGGGNRFGALAGGAGAGGGGSLMGRVSSQNPQPSDYGITTADIKADLTEGKGRPIWIFSAYGPGRNAPRQLFGGPQREQSFEEMRLRHYEAAAAGNAEQAAQEAQALYVETENQMRVILNDLDGAVKYILDGINEHPNRIDITEGRTEPSSTQGQGASPFGQPSAFGQSAAATQVSGFGQPSSLGAQQSPFGKPSAFGQPSTMGQTSAFGQPSVPGQTSAFGQPSAPGQTSAFGQPSAPAQASGFGQPSAPAQASGFGQPSAMGQGSAFGKPSGLGGQQGAFGKPAFGQSSFGQPGFGQPSGGGASAFGKPSVTSPFAQVSNQAQGMGGGTGFAQAASTVSPFAQTAGQQQQPASSGFGQPTPSQPSAFGQPAQAASPFGQAQQPPASQPFGQPSNVANPFGAAAKQPAPSPFGQAAGGISQAQQQAAVPTATAGTGPPAVIKTEDPNQLAPIPPLNGQTVRDPVSKRLSMWKGQPVKYIENVPCYLHPQDRQTYVHIFFPDGPPDEASLRDAQAKPEEYTPEVTEQYEFFVKNGYFKDGVVPSVPPKTEWVSFDF